MSDVIKTGTKDVLSHLRSRFSKIPRNVALLLDISGSMETKAGQLRELASKYKGVRRFVFSDDCIELLPHEGIPPLDGGTHMANAFLHLKIEGIVHTVIITDGAPNPPEEDVLKAAAGLKVDILYAGPPPPPPFLEKLAKATGGSYGNVSLEDLLSIESKIQKLLPAPKGAIEL